MKETHSITELKKQAQAGNPEAQARLGCHYYTGQEIEKNIPQALHWLNAAAEQGSMDATFALGSIYLTGADTIPADPEKAVEYLTLAARNEYAAAQCMLGLCYQQGRGVMPDQGEAMLWLRLAAANGDPDAQTILNTTPADRSNPKRPGR